MQATSAIRAEGKSSGSCLSVACSDSELGQLGLLVPGHESVCTSTWHSELAWPTPAPVCSDVGDGDAGGTLGAAFGPETDDSSYAETDDYTA